MNDTAIICLGNRYAAGDDVGWRTFEHLRNFPLPADIDLYDGGLGGLDLLRLVEGRRRVVFADTLAEPPSPDTVRVLGQAEIAAWADGYGHSAGLPYLLHMLPQVCPHPWPEIALVGAASPVRPTTVRSVAERCMEIARHGIR